MRGVPDADALRALREGLTLPDGTRYREAAVRALGVARGGCWLEVTLTEGKNRQVRRMCAAVGHEVEQLVRVRIGRLALPDLEPGRWRALTPEEVALLRRR